MMIEIIRKHIKDVENFSLESTENSEEFRIKYLGKKGILNELFKNFKEVKVNERKLIGREINILKSKVKEKIIKFRSEKNEDKDNLSGLDGVFTYFVATKDSLGMAKDTMAAKPLVLYESDDLVAMGSEEIAIRSVLPQEIDTYDPFDGEVKVWRI